jgi:D-alanine-D-alanine ligase-like ATP-grasp enzyme
VGEKLFPCRVFSQADDYRYSTRSGYSTKIKRATLPDEISARCLHLCAALQLPVAGLDLRRTPSGEWFCFEVNPSPGFTFYQDATNQPIAAAIACFLAEKSK